MNSPASYGFKLQCVTVFDVVHPVLLRMSRSVMVITAREVYRYKMAYHGDKFLHIGAVTITIRCTMQLKKNYNPELSQLSTLQISKDLFVYKRKNCALYCMVSTFRP